MAQGLIYMVEGGELRRMKPSAPENEDRMQALVAQYPELITDGDGDLLLVTREQQIADSEDGAGRWSLDHLFITRDAVPVLVELKRAADTRLRREVVGQILDYAANATAYWPLGRIADAFANTVTASGGNPDQVLSHFLGDRDQAAFWSQVDSNFRAGRIKLVIVADDIPRELARIIEFLNDQMRADVRGVELRWFEGEGNVVTLSPRVIGETERAAVSKGPTVPLEQLSTEQWLERHIAPLGPSAMAGAQAYTAIVQRLGGTTAVTKAQGSLFAEFTGDEGRPFYPSTYGARVVRWARAA